MLQTISKSQFKAQVLEYLRNVEEKKQPLIVTHAGKPVIKVSPYEEDPQATLKALRGTVIEYKYPTEPVGEDEWEILK